jgi:hypothetical protein
MDKANIRINAKPATLPANWRAGFNGRYQPACGGKETPYIENGQWKLMVWDGAEQCYYIYNYSTDIFEPSERRSPDPDLIKKLNQK